MSKYAFNLAFFLLVVLSCSNNPANTPTISGNDLQTSYFYSFTLCDNGISAEIDTVDSMFRAKYSFDWKFPIIDKNWGMQLYSKTENKFVPTIENIVKDTIIITTSTSRFVGCWQASEPTKLSFYFEQYLPNHNDYLIKNYKYELILFRPENH